MAVLSELELEQFEKVIESYPNNEDLDLTAFIAEVIGITGVHTEEGWYNQDINETHITFYFMSDEEIDFSEDTNENEEYYIQVDIWSKDTKECYDGVNLVDVKNAAFRAYDSWEESVEDHSTFLKANKRYKEVIGETDYKKACEAIKAAGYATDPDYVEKLVKLIEDYELTEFDEAAVSQEEEKEAEDKKYYRVQAGAFRRKEGANLMAEKIKKTGHTDVFVKLLNGLYKVQVGAYSQKSNAEATVKKLKAAGISCFITYA